MDFVGADLFFAVRAHFCFFGEGVTCEETSCLEVGVDILSEVMLSGCRLRRVCMIVGRRRRNDVERRAKAKLKQWRITMKLQNKHNNN